jgi:hypothetical protein
MPSVIACQPDGVAVADLSGTGRLGLAGTSWQGGPALALVWRYPPSPAFLLGHDGRPISLAPYSLAALVRTPMVVAQQVDEAQRIADAAMAGGTPEGMVARLTEGMELFKNMPRYRAEVLASCTTDALAVLKAFCDVRDWLIAGCAERREIDACEHHLVLLP